MDAGNGVIRSRRVLLPGGVQPASIHIRNGIIDNIGDYHVSAGEDFGDVLMMAGLVDTHVHINEPGRTEWEGFETATKAAAAGGTTTLIEMPLNSIPATTTLAAYETKLQAAEAKLWVDTGFWGGVVPGNTADLQPLWDAGCFGFKCFLAPSGVDEFENVTENDLRQAMPELARLGAVLLVHAELPSELRGPSGDCKTYLNYLRSRPRGAEDAAIALLIKLSRETRCRVHVVHLSSSDSVQLLKEAQSAGMPITVETCPHYLVFSSEDIPSGATEYKCAPPIREASNQDALWEALKKGVIRMVVTDHSPSPPSMKRRDTGDFFSAWGGIASLQLALPAVWTEAKRRGFSISDLAGWMCEFPSRLAGLGDRKGRIAPGYDADLVIWDPEAEFDVDPAQLHHRHPITPYARRRLTGVVKNTYLRGVRVDIGGPARGKILRRGRL